MNNQLEQSLNKVMKDTHFTHRGCLCERLIGGYKWNNQKFTKLSDLDEAITQSINAISDSIKKASV